MKYVVLLILGVFLCGTNVKAQEYNFVKGAIITLSMDTIYGEVKDATNFPLAYFEYVMFKEEGKVVRKYSPNEIYGYLKNGKLNITQSLPIGTNVFMEEVVSGKLSYMKYVYIDKTGSKHDKKNKAVNYYFSFDGANVTQVKGQGFKRKMKKYFHAYPEVVAKIQSKEFKYKNLKDLINYFNTNY